MEDQDKEKKAKADADAKAKAEADEKAKREKEESDKDASIPKHRFDEVNTELQKYKKAEEKRKADEAEAEKKKLEEQGKFQELLNKEKTEKAELQSKYERSAKASALKLEAVQAGTVDADAVLALTNLDEVKLLEDGSIDPQSVKTVIENLKSSKAYLFGEGGKPNVNIGNNGGAPNGGNSQTPYFKRSQLRDSTFYAENKTEIMKAVREGRIIDDITPKPKAK